MAGAQVIRVLSSLALKGTLEGMRGELEGELGPLEPAFDATQAIVPRLRLGERADLVVLTAAAMDELVAAGEVTRFAALGASGIGLAVRAGAPRPDIATTQSFRAALEAAPSVAYSKVGASGLYFAGLVERLGIRLRKAVVVEKGPVGLAVARGEAELGLQQLCELAPVPGIDIVGPLPAALQKTTLFSAGVLARAPNAAGALALLERLRSAPARAAIRAGGLEPP